MNPWVILVALLTVGALTGGAYLQGRKDGRDGQLADAARDEAVAAIASDAAASAVAAGLAHMEVRNVTITKALEREVQTREVYRDCRSGPDAMRLLNSTDGIAPAASAPAGAGELPASGAAR